MFRRTASDQPAVPTVIAACSNRHPNSYLFWLLNSVRKQTYSIQVLTHDLIKQNTKKKAIILLANTFKALANLMFNMGLTCLQTCPKSESVLSRKHQSTLFVFVWSNNSATGKR